MRAISDTMPLIRIIAAVALAFSVVACNRSAGTGVNRSNVLLIIADDLGWNQLGCYSGPYHTPHIDSLAAAGMRFTNAYSSAAVCSPTRAALMTGKYPARLHLTDFIAGSQFPDSLLTQPDWQKYLPLEEITLAEVFAEHGYKTALFGKWHLSIKKNPPGSLPYNPDKQGFDESMITYKPVNGLTDPEADPHNVDTITSRSISFLQENREYPFFLVVSHNAIHDPVMESLSRINDYSARFPDPDYHVEPVTGAMVSRLDSGVGRLLSALEGLGLKENTLVIFCSDNGGKESYASQYPFRKGKGWLYEGGIRVPMIVRWPGKIEPESETGIITSSIDLFPTILELAGLPLAHPVDGNSLAAEILGENAQPGKTQYWHYPHYHRGSGMKPASAIRDGRYKLIEWHEEYLSGGYAWELYDLISDPGETVNLAGEQPGDVARMRKQLHDWRREVGARMPELK